MVKFLFAGYATVDIIDDKFFLGGAAGAMSINAGKEKVKPYLSAVIGKDRYGRYYRQALVKRKVDLSFCKFNAPGNPICRIGDPFGLGSEREWSDNGANKYLKEIEFSPGSLSRFKLIFLANCHPLLINKIHYSNPSRNLIYIPGPQVVSRKNYFQQQILDKTKIIFCNQEEAPYIFRNNPFSHKVEMVVVTKGKKGGVVYSQKGEKIVFDPPRVEKVVDPTGAGDCFALGFCLAFIRTSSIKQAIEKGQALAKEIISKKGAIL